MGSLGVKLEFPRLRVGKPWAGGVCRGRRDSGSAPTLAALRCHVSHQGVQLRPKGFAGLEQAVSHQPQHPWLVYVLPWHYL